MRGSVCCFRRVYIIVNLSHLSDVGKKDVMDDVLYG